MKRVLVFSLAYFPFVGGAEIALREVMSRLSDKYDFTVVTAKMRGLPSFEVMDGIKVRRLGFGVQWLDKLLFFPLSVLYGFFHSFDFAFGLLENQAALSALFTSWLKRVPCVVNLQSGDSEEYMRKKLGSFYFLYNLVYGKRAKYVVLSNYLKDRAVQHGVPVSNITIVPNGVDSSVFTSKGVDVKSVRKELDADGKKVIITASRLTLKNAVDDVIRAFAIVKKKVKSVLVICGSGEDEMKLRSLASELSVANDVRFLGLVDYKSLPKYLSASDVFVRPSISEGFGNSFVEALSCGVPIVGTRVGGIPDFLVDKKTGLFCSVRDPVDLADKLVLLLKNRKLANSIVKNGQKMVKSKYEWSRVAGMFDEVFESL